MKILHITSSFPNYEKTHEGSFILDLVNGISRYKISLFVLAPHFPGGKWKECWGNIRIYRFFYFFPTRFECLAYGSGFVYNLQKNFLTFVEVIPFFFAELLSSLLLVKKLQIDVIHSHWLLPQGLIGAILHRIYGIPHIATIHGSDLSIIKNYSFLMPVCHFIIRNSNTITVNSRYMRQQLISITPSWDSKTKIIPMGVDPAQFRSRDNFVDIKKQYGADYLLLHIGRFIDLKGTIFLIDAIPEVIKTCPGTVLLIFGSGPEEKKLVERVKILDLEKNIKFLGLVNPKDLINYYQSADVFILPSINISGKTEGLGVVLLEAMASGCPVIGSNVGGIPDIIIDNENGFLIEEQRSDILAKRIIQILSDEIIQTRFRENGYKRVQDNFSWNRIAGQFTDIYTQALGR